tara:strand:+ start:19657 stop:19854 length:198 start_codon:yes stop_codon:yes gene_type:complete
MAICNECFIDFPDARKALGYDVCIKCGDKHARKEAIRKSKCIAPLFNKGSYQYIGNINAAKHIGR